MKLIGAMIQSERCRGITSVDEGAQEYRDLIGTVNKNRETQEKLADKDHKGDHQCLETRNQTMP